MRLYDLWLLYRIGNINSIFANDFSGRNEREMRRKLKSSTGKKKSWITPHQSNREKLRRIKQMRTGKLHVDPISRKVINFN